MIMSLLTFKRRAVSSQMHYILISDEWLVAAVASVNDITII